MWKAIFWLKEKSNLKMVITLTIVFFIFLGLMNGNVIGTAKLNSITGGAGILDANFGYSPDKAYSVLENQGTEGRQFYTNMLYFDFVFPFVYMMFGVITIGFLLKLCHIKTRRLNLLLLAPVLAAICDWTENIFILLMIGKFPAKLALTAHLASTFTVMKIIFIAVFLAAVIVLLLCAIHSSLMGRRTKVKHSS